MEHPDRENCICEKMLNFELGGKGRGASTVEKLHYIITCLEDTEVE